MLQLTQLLRRIPGCGSTRSSNNESTTAGIYISSIIPLVAHFWLFRSRASKCQVALARHHAGATLRKTTLARVVPALPLARLAPPPHFVWRLSWPPGLFSLCRYLLFVLSSAHSSHIPCCPSESAKTSLPMAPPPHFLPDAVRVEKGKAASFSVLVVLLGGLWPFRLDRGERPWVR